MSLVARAGPAALWLGAGFAGACAIGWALSFAVPESLDRRLLLAINPDRARPWLDASMVAATDYAIPYVAILLGCLGVAAEAIVRGWMPAARRLPLFALLGVVLGAGSLAIFGARFVDSRVPIAMTPWIVVGFAIAGANLRRIDAAGLARLRRTFWLTLIAVLLTELAIEFVRAAGPARARPFATANAPWNDALRVIPDEHVRRAGSFPSGHAGAICALLAPAFWIARRRWLRGAMLAVAALCVYSRVYLAAHFPSDALVGAAIGAALGSCAVWVLDRPSSGCHAAAISAT